MKSALVIIDMQNDFMPWGTLPVKNADKIIPTIQKISPNFDLVIATCDYHPVDHVSFALNHGKKPGECIEVHGVKQQLWPTHCVQGTLGAEIPFALQSCKIHHKVFKGTEPNIDSYSAFFDNAKKHKTRLDSYLKKKKIDTLFFVGVATEYCVKFSVLDALELGYKVYVIKDACKGVEEKEGKKAFSLMEEKGALLTSSKKIPKN